MENEEFRSRSARAAAERALVHIAHHYGGESEFVVLGGLVPDLLCSRSSFTHAGTTDIDVQVDLEIACGAVNERQAAYRRSQCPVLSMSQTPHQLGIVCNHPRPAEPLRPTA